jgi:DNA-directed RNA polymerase subunit E'/Rpb7
MPDAECEYRPNENVYIFRDELKIDKESKVRCKVVEIEI